MGFRYADFTIERTSPTKVALRQCLASPVGTKEKIRTIGKYPGYASALADLLSRLAEQGKDIREVESLWFSFAQHLERTYTLISEIEQMEMG